MWLVDKVGGAWAVRGARIATATPTPTPTRTPTKPEGNNNKRIRDSDQIKVYLRPVMLY